jgi:hypothetical protein
MSFEVRPPDAATGTYDATGRIAPAPQDADGRFARVYELERARTRREAALPTNPDDRIPDQVWDQVDAAARLVESLEAQGKRMVFDTDRLSGRVVASLLRQDGTTTAVPLTEAVDPGALGADEDGPEEVAWPASR